MLRCECEDPFSREMEFLLQYQLPIMEQFGMMAYGFDETRIRRILDRDLDFCKGCQLDITLKDVETVEKDPDRVRYWVAFTREILEERFK